MRMVQAGCTCLVAAAMLFSTGCAKAVLLGAASVLQSPQSAFYAVNQIAAQTVEASLQNKAPTPNPTACPTSQPAPQTQQAQAQPTATATPTPVNVLVHGALLGEIALIPDTGMPVGAGGVIEQSYPNGSGNAYLPLKAGTLRNMTSVPNETVRAAIEAGVPFTVEINSTQPQVLIMHTHATETYRQYEGLYYNLDDTARTTDKTYNVCAVGNIMAQTLNDAGIYTLHDTTLNDYPSYNDSYDNSHAVVEEYLAKYPSIKVVIDVHRDAIGDEESWYAPVAQVAGKQSAQVMIIAGCDNGGSIQLPNCMQNLGFAAAWQAQIEGAYPGLTRSTMFNYKYYNQDLTTGSLLMEVGGHGNTLNEALYAGQLAAQQLAVLLAQQSE